MKKDTLLTHIGRDPSRTHGTVNMPVYRASTIVFPDFETYSTRPGDDYKIPRYGIHGTPDPDKIGRAESNGCIRLTNWDAARLSLMVKAGVPAIFQL